MRLRNALALGVTAATTGTAVLALTTGPASAASAPATVSAEPGPAPGPAASPGPGSGLGASPGLGPRSSPGAGPGAERRDTPPSCGKESDPDFPIDTRVQGGPADYVPGGDFRTWNVELTNTTTEPCHSIHPVLVLADRDRVLEPAQIKFDFYDSEARRWRPVRFEGTEEDECVGVFSDFPGLAVPAGRKVTVPVRLAFRADTAPNEVVANAAIVQRKGDDGDWVGESADYRLTITAEGEAEDVRESSPPLEASPPPKGDTGLPPTRPLPELAQTGDESAATVALTSAAGGLLLTGTALTAAGARRRRDGNAPPAPGRQPSA
ncbi:hypothetical protein [Streptomyces sp. NPDC093600]|uniref:hypothetical protein n=1 Tax=Streptomyces sp. NPDC093600 TaxID=3366047 RepID=UPI0038046006